MAGNNIWEEEVRNRNNLIDQAATERNIYITTKKTTTPNNRRLSLPRFQLLFSVIHRTRSDTNPTTEAQILCSQTNFFYLFDRFASVEEAKPLVASMFFVRQIPFSFNTERQQGLHWKEFITDESSAVERVPLQGLDEVVTRISKAAVRLVHEASASGRKLVEMAVTIDKRTVVPQLEFERLIPHHVEISEMWDPENPRLYVKIQYYCQLQFLHATSFIERSRFSGRWLYDDDNDHTMWNNHHWRELNYDQAESDRDQRELNLAHRELDQDHSELDQDQIESDQDQIEPDQDSELDQDWIELDYYQNELDHDDQNEVDYDHIELMRLMEEGSFLLEVLGSLWEGKSAGEALEKFRYQKSIEDEDEDKSKSITCVICMEEVMIGSQVSCMPCSHLYHFDCISQWLQRNPTCPICRFELPSRENN